MSAHAAETLKALEEAVQKRCIGTLKGGACICATECSGACRLATEAAKPCTPYSCSPLTDEQIQQVQGEADEARADAAEATHRRRHPEEYL